MLKLINWNTREIIKVKEKYCTIKTIKVPRGLVDTSYIDYRAEFKNIIQQNLQDVDNSTFLYLDFIITEEGINKEDIEIIYDTIEGILTDLLVEKTQHKEEEHRLGLYGIPNDIKMKTSNLLTWLNFTNKCTALNFEVHKNNSVWKKRMIK